MRLQALQQAYADSHCLLMQGFAIKVPISSFLFYPHVTFLKASKDGQSKQLGVHASRPEDVRECMTECLENLKTDYVDLFLIHQPIGLTREAKNCAYTDYHLYLDPTSDYLGIWKAMEKIVDSGLTKSIGVSNFNQKQLTEILHICKIKPAIIQTECHPYLQEKELLQFCKENGIIMEAYGALGSPNINSFYKETFECDFTKDEVIGNIAKRQNRSIAQILLRYQIQRGVVVLPKSSNSGRLKDNINIFDFCLTPSEMSDISNLDRGKRIFNYESLRTHKDYPW